MNLALNISFWSCPVTWTRSLYNTSWCLLGCSIGDLGTIAFFQFYGAALGLAWSTLSIMALAIVNGILTSIMLETVILLRQGLGFQLAFRTAIGMSLISMIAMETAMNATDWAITGGAQLTLVAVPLMLLAGLITPWPYNYWRLKKFNRACC